MNPWIVSFTALTFGAVLLAVGMRPRRFRPMAGAWGAFPVRAPFGKLAAFVVAAGTLPGAWKMAERYAPPVQWADKAVYVQVAKDSLIAFVRPKLLPLPRREDDTVYRVWVVDLPAGRGKGAKTLYLDDALFSLGVKPRLMSVSEDPALLWHVLDRVVYHGHFFKMFQWAGIGWFSLSFVMLCVGAGIDMRRLRQARNLGVHLEGNREVSLKEWNKAAGRSA